MIKKASLMLATVAALALLGSATADASTGLTTGKSPGGTLLPVGSLVRWTSSNSFTITSTKLGQIKCGTFVLGGKLAKNSASEGFESTGTGENSVSNCTVSSGASFTITGLKLVNFKSPASTPGQGTLTFSVTFNFPGQSCSYAATDAPFTYVANTEKLTLTKAALTTTGTACGTSTLDAEFRPETTAGATVFIM